jgi:putative aminopeptidase FrvX
MRHGFREHLSSVSSIDSPGDVATGMSKARNVSNADGIGMVGEYDRDRLGSLSGRLDGDGRREDYVHVHADQIGHCLDLIQSR